MTAADRLQVDLVLPVHNEAASVEATVDEWLRAATVAGVDLRIVVCEDGSTDDTRAVVQRLADHRPLLVVTGAERKGYSKAVVDGLRSTTAPWVCCADGDGQCDPADLQRLLARRGEDHVVVGIRRPRHDPFARRAMSAAFEVVFRRWHGIELEDPSSPFCCMSGAVAHAVAASDPVLPQGYWWEFHIRRARLGQGVVELPIHHRDRSAGSTQVYLPRRVVPIAVDHLRGLWRLRSA